MSKIKNRNPVAKVVTKIRNQVIKPKKGKGSFIRNKMGETGTRGMDTNQVSFTENQIIEDGAAGVAPANNVGSGNIAGVGVGPKGEPGIQPGTKTNPLRRKKLKEEVFAGNKVFEVDPTYFHKCRLGKRKHANYKFYVGEDDVGKEIREYGNSNPKKPIIIKDKNTGSMQFLRYGGNINAH